MRPIKLPNMSKTEVKKLVEDQILCRIAFKGKDAPHIAPFQYAQVNGQLYFHFTNYGKKIGLLEEGSPVCVEIEQYNPNLSEYRFVVLTGKLKIVVDTQERSLAVERMVNTAKKKGLSENFLAAHGFPKEMGWDSLKASAPITIVKLDPVTEITGLRSPQTSVESNECPGS